MNIKTNNIPRNMLYFSELSKDEQDEMIEIYGNDADNMDYFSYKNCLYCTADFLCCGEELMSEGWDGIASDSYFSGTLIKQVNDDQVIVGSYFC